MPDRLSGLHASWRDLAAGRKQDASHFPAQPPAWLAKAFASAQRKPAWLERQLAAEGRPEIGSPEWCEAWLRDGQAALDRIERGRMAKWERNRAGREMGEAAWRAANERHPERRPGAYSPLAPVASFWPDAPTRPWIR
jgi:hypothetical protein